MSLNIVDKVVDYLKDRGVAHGGNGNKTYERQASILSPQDEP